MKLLALIVDTFREIYARKIVLGIVGIELLALLVTGLVIFSDGMQSSYEATRQTATSQPSGTSDTQRPAPGFVDRDDSLLSELEDDSTLAAADSLLAGDSLLMGDTGAGVGEGSRAFEGPPPIEEGGPVDQPIAPRSGEQLLREAVKGQLAGLSVMIAAAVMFLGIFATAGIVPSMMEKGTVDLLISKPLRRTELLFGRALGGVLAVAINLIGFLLALWALYGVASGVWYFPFVSWTFLLLMFAFITLYSGIILLNVLTESWVLPMSLAYIHMTVLSMFLSNREETLFQLISAEWLRGLIEGLYWLLPQVQDVLQAIPLISFSGIDLPWAAFAQCLAFTVVMLGLAAWRFETKDF